MKSKIIIPIVIGVIAVGIAAAVLSSDFEAETVNLDMERTHGTVSTALGSPLLGSESAPITIVEFGDYQCHQCKNWFHNTKPAITQNYIETGKASLVFVDLAFLGKDSRKAAEASYCAEEQGKYWEYHDLVYSNQEEIDDGWANSERLKDFAFMIGLDLELFENCLDSGKYKKRVQFNIDQAKKNGANATPTFIIVGPDGQTQQKIVGAQPYSVFRNVMDSMV